MIERPLFIIGAPRSGTTILYRSLALHRHLWHLPGESHDVLEGPLHPFRSAHDSNRVGAASLGGADAEAIRRAFVVRSINLSLAPGDPAWMVSGSGFARRFVTRFGVPLAGRVSALRRPDSIRLIEKTPKNSLRVALLAAVFPDARFVHLIREPRSNIDSLVAGWRSRDRFGPVQRERFVSYRIPAPFAIRGATPGIWKFALIPGWRELDGLNVEEVATRQYAACNRCALDDFRDIEADKVMRIRYEDFASEPARSIEAILDWAELSADDTVARFVAELPRINTSEPSRRGGELRDPKAVARGIESCEGMTELVRDLGYALQSPCASA